MEAQDISAQDIIEQNEEVRYEFKTQIRYSECDHLSHLKVPALIDLFQDCSTFHSEVVGVGVRDLLARDRAWVLCRWHIVIDRYPEAFEWVKVGTFATRFRSMMADRNFYIQDEIGEVIVRASSTWAYMDLANNKPQRIEEAHVKRYGLRAALSMPAEKRKVIRIEPTQPLEPVEIVRHHIDTNEHVNNSQYVQNCSRRIASKKCSRAAFALILRRRLIWETPRIRASQPKKAERLLNWLMQRVICILLLN